MKVPAWRITPGVNYDHTIVPCGFEDAWGLREQIDQAVDGLLDVGLVGARVLVEVVEMELAELLDLDCGECYAIEYSPALFIEQFGEDEVRKADAERPSGDRHWPDTPGGGQGGG